MMKYLSGFVLIFYSLLFSITGAQAADAITTNSLNMRSGPGTRHAVTMAIPRHYPLYINGCQGSWCQVNYRGYIGWVSARYLAFNEGAPMVARRYVPAAQTTIIIGGYRGPRYVQPRWRYRHHYSHRRYYGGYYPRGHWHHRGGQWHHRGGYWRHR